jgi:aldose 1-epimerase
MENARMTIAQGTIDGLEAITITGEIEASFVPGAGMVGCSLRHRGEELLGQRSGLKAYAEEGTTMGIPLLYPWANRLSSERFTVAGRDVDVQNTTLRDPNGLPIHGLLGAERGWRVERSEPREDGGTLAASLDFGARPDLLGSFPFPHLLRLEASLTGAKLAITLTVEANADSPVPISFGFHPYLQLPHVPRAEWEIEVPVREQLALDAGELPTGARAPAEVAPGPLGERTFDDEFLAPPGGAPFVLSGGGRTISLAFEGGYPFSQLFAPPDDDVIAFEPMTAPTDALVSGSDLRVLEPGERYEAAFSIEVS